MTSLILCGFYLFGLLGSLFSLAKRNIAKAIKAFRMSPRLFHWAFDQHDVGSMSNTLTVLDNRTRRRYKIPIRHNAVNALEFQKITTARFGGESVGDFESGLRVFDPGYLNTACVESSITFIDGKRGYIQYRGYPIEYLVEKHDYEEVIHLLIWGHLPNAPEKKSLQRKIAAGCVPPEHVIQVIRSFPRDSLTSTMVIAGVAAYASRDEGATRTLQSGCPEYLGQPEKVDAALISSLSALATVVALAYCHKRGKAFTPVDPEATFIENVMKMMGFGEGASDKPNSEMIQCFNRLWILYADHEMTNSTAAFLHAASTLADPLSCCISGIVSGYGPLHGGAIDLAYKAFENLKAPENVPALIADVKAKKQRLFGYGHRIYKAIDPRAKIIRAMIDQHKNKFESNSLLAVAMEIDRVANMDEYFTSRSLKANADLYGCFLYTAFGFESDIIVAMASLSRIPGVLAHWREAMLEKAPLLWRPQQIFTGTLVEEQCRKYP
ncbi:citrate synthase [Colletotrichum spaethianum]|uniref:Citrate synthase n=1 Tax=Colletotrichum spaethianum TaxID=700344 RepID=A0AA37PAK2_9PEZI|nr:citrate synthase [Colletotrichum spaethianum]GKT48641.1 citrate synthase [Colletotrichum spaethianum]